VVVIGGGLAGLVASAQLVKAGVPCTLVEKKVYPFHRVCGEYISNEAVPFLEANGLFPSAFNPPRIGRFTLSSAKGKSSTMPLDLGGFGISRYTYDNFLYEKAKALGVTFLLDEEAESTRFEGDKFFIRTSARTLEADVVIGSFGKRSRMDHALQRKFIRERSPYVAVKYHIRTEHPNDLIALHNFKGGYCGMSNIEDGKTTLCYLTHRDQLKRFKNIRDLEEQVMFQNPLLKEIFTHAEFLFERPEVIN